MSTLLETMVDTCDRLTGLLCGKTATSNPLTAEAALEAIELLADIESWVNHGTQYPETNFNKLKHRVAVMGLIADVMHSLHEAGLIYRPPAITEPMLLAA